MREGVLHGDSQRLRRMRSGILIPDWYLRFCFLCFLLCLLCSVLHVCKFFCCWSPVKVYDLISQYHEGAVPRWHSWSTPCWRSLANPCRCVFFLQ